MSCGSGRSNCHQGMSSCGCVNRGGGEMIVFHGCERYAATFPCVMLSSVKSSSIQKHLWPRSWMRSAAARTRISPRRIHSYRGIPGASEATAGAGAAAFSSRLMGPSHLHDLRLLRLGHLVDLPLVLLGQLLNLL